MSPKTAQALDYIREHVQNKKNFAELKRDACILFVDLVGSTEFKRHHGAFEGLTKTAIHNAVAADGIRELGGRVAKYLGDGVLGVFEGDEAEYRAIRAGLTIIVGIEKANEQQEWEHFPLKMDTKVGINSGQVVMFKFPESNEEDPQGKTVDLAARLVDLAGPQQLVCTEETYQAAMKQQDAKKGKEKNHVPRPESQSVTNETERLVKGCNELIKLRAIAPQDRSPGDILLSGHERKTPDRVMPRLNEARNALNSGDPNRLDEALTAFQEVVENDPGNFEANFRAAQILLEKSPPTRREEIKILEQVMKHLALAKQSRPQSCRAWHLAAWTRLRRFQLMHEPRDLELSVKFAEIALQHAEDLMDTDGVFLTRTCLARKLLERSWESKENGSEDIARAAELCEKVAETVDSLHGASRAEYLLTHALVRLGQFDTDFESIEKMIQDGEIADPRNQKLELAKEKLRQAKHGNQRRRIPI